MTEKLAHQAGGGTLGSSISSFEYVCSLSTTRGAGEFCSLRRTMKGCCSTPSLAYRSCGTTGGPSLSSAPFTEVASTSRDVLCSVASSRAEASVFASVAFASLSAGEEALAV